MNLKKLIWILVAGFITCACVGISAPDHIKTDDSQGAEQGNGNDPEIGTGESPDDEDTQFPDPILKEYILYLYDADKDGLLNEEELHSADRIHITNNDLESAKGIELLPYLSELALCGTVNSEDLPSDGKLTSIDLSHNTKLKNLVLDYQNLTELDISHNTDLSYLGTFKNPIKSIDIHNNVNLVLFGMGYCQLESIDVSGLEKLDELHLDHNNLTGIRLGGNKSLRYIDASYNCLTELDLTGCPKIEEVHTEGNPGLKSITLKKGQVLGVVTKDSETVLEYID